MTVRRSNRLLLIPVLFLIAVACNQNVVFDQRLNLENAVWSSEKISKFDFYAEDTLAYYNFYITVRNNTDYPFANLYLFFTTYFPDNTYATDTIECFLARPDGKWLGKGKGFYRDSKILLHRNVRFGHSGLFSFEFEQAMRQEPLSGIESIGLRIERVN